MVVGSDPVFEVSDFVAIFNQSIEAMYPRVGLVGELTNFRVSRNRWVYFDLKDENSSVKFFATVQTITQPLEDGLRLEVFGKPRLHPLYGFSINVESLRPVGEGSIKKAKDLLAQKLRLEGLFDKARKRNIPEFPERIGIITSEKSAAFVDFCKIVANRWGGLQLLLVDVQVQGYSSANEVVKAIETINQIADPPEVIVIVRGGGSPEDLACFSEEKVVRAVASSRVPTIVAIGHEIDVSLAELAADKRCSTPSNAAELLVPDKNYENRLLIATKENIREKILNQIKVEHERYLTDYRSNIRSLEALLEVSRLYIDHSKQLVHVLDPSHTLKKGYAIIRKDSEKIVKSIKDIKSRDNISITLQDGTIKGRIN